MSKHTVRFPGGLVAEAESGATLKEVMNDAGINFDFPCGGRGKCGKCKIRLHSGTSEPTAEDRKSLTDEEIADGIRLACVAEVTSDMHIDFLADKNIRHQILLFSLNRSAEIEPHFVKRYLEVDKATVDDMRTDWQRVKDSIAAQGGVGDDLYTQVSVVRKAPDLLKSSGNKVTAVLYNNEIRGLEAGNTTDTLLGMAFDIGTTTIVGYLLDLYTGRELSIVSTLNPQTAYGADVISRITHVTLDANGLEDLHKSVTRALDTLLEEAAQKAAVSRNDIYTVTVVGNTAMHHLFVGINPSSVALAPYVPVISEPMQIEPQDLQIRINPAGKVFVLPNIAGFVGADTIGVLLATELDESPDIKLVIDIGTNGEMALGNKDKILACSTAAGPAFEGAQISCGMRGATGAIDHVQFGDELDYSVIGDVSPLGVCGSALLDTVAGLVEMGLIDGRGRFMKPDEVTHPIGLKLKDRLISYHGSMAFLIAGDPQNPDERLIVVTQKDIRELQLAKGAMATGIKILMLNYGLTVEDIREVQLAGAFGNYLNPHSACVIGLIPPELEDRITMVGNAAGEGSKLALLSKAEYKRAAHSARNVKFIELGSDPNFTSIFAESMLFYE